MPVTPQHTEGQAFVASWPLYQPHCDTHDWHGREFRGSTGLLRARRSAERHVARHDSSVSWHISNCYVFQAFCNVCALCAPERGHHDGSTGSATDLAAYDRLVHNALIHDDRAALSGIARPRVII